MKKIVEVSYECSICKTVYDTKREALKCERGKKEPRKFSKGDFVKTNIKLIGCNGQVNHYCSGEIIAYELRSSDFLRDASIPPLPPQIIKKYSHIWEYYFKCIKDGQNCSALQCDLELTKTPNR